MSSDGNSGVFWMLGGLVVLVMTAVGLSLLVDRRFQFAHQNGNVRDSISADAETLAGLVDSRDRGQAELDRTEGPRLRDSKDFASLQERVAADAKHLAELKKTATATRTATETLVSDFAKYRSSYRAHAWEAAAGEQVPFIALRNGRVMKK